MEKIMRAHDKKEKKAKEQARKQQERRSAPGPTSDRPSVVTIMSHQYSWAGGVALHCYAAGVSRSLGHNTLATWPHAVPLHMYGQ